MAPRPFLVVSADGDKYSQDAEVVVEAARDAYDAVGQGKLLEHARYAGGHPLTEERFGRILDWIISHNE
jgi:hypothetical protein